MRVLLASPIFSQWHDAGLFWLNSLCRQGHMVSVWDYRLDLEHPAVDVDLSLVMKGPVDTSRLPGKKVLYWPDAFERTPEIGTYISQFDQVFTPVRPTPEGMTWLPTGWEPRLHYSHSVYRSIPDLFVGTYSQRKARFLEVIRPAMIVGNGWPQHFHATPAVYLHEFVALLSTARVVVNVHRDPVGVNRRFFESCACALTLHDDVPGVREILGDALFSRVVFNSPEHGKEMREWFHVHPAEMNSLWELEQKAIAPYTYDAAVQEVLRGS